MFRLLAFILFFISFSAPAGKYYFKSSVTWGGIHMVTADEICGSSLDECANSTPASFTRNGSLYEYCGYSATTSTKFTVNYFEEKFAHLGCNDKYIVSIYQLIDDGLSCSNNAECFHEANESCQSSNQELSDFQYIGTPSADSYQHSCGTPPDPAQDCEDSIISQCANHLGAAESIFSEDGLGNASCSGTCNDGSAAEESCIETLANNYCDIVEPPSELDFSGGNTGSSVDPSNTTAEDSVNDIDYEPDGTAADPTAPFSSIQGDKLINEVIKNRNDNTENLAATTDTTNQTIVEKSDDISETVSNSANGIIDAINDIPPFYDGNIVQGMEQFNVKIENLSDIFGNLKEDFGELKDDLDSDLGTDYVHTTQHASFASFDALFSADSGTQLEELVEGLKLVIKTESVDFHDALKNLVSIDSPSVGEYEQKSLELSGWGTFDISLSRFTALFGGLGNIIYFLAAMTAMTIVLGGIRL